jgi:hypothetical protein
MPKKEKQNQPLAKVAFRFPGSLTYNATRFMPNTGFSSKTRKSVERRSQRKGAKESGAWTGCPRRLSSFRACPHPTGSSRLIDSAGSDLAGTARTECGQSLSSVLLTSARQGLDNKGEKYLGFKRKVKRYSDSLTSYKIVFLNQHNLSLLKPKKNLRAQTNTLHPPQVPGLMVAFHGTPTKESITLLLQVLWVPVSINIGQNW